MPRVAGHAQVTTLVVYISGHGFGHAARVIEVLNAAGARHPSWRMIVCTSAPHWLFDLTMRVPFEWREVQADTGIVQRDSLSHDIAATLRQLAAFHASFDARATREAEFLRSAGATMVMADIPPLAFAAAARAGVPAVALGNFTWDWIYEGYEETEACAPRVLEQIREAYARGREAWRLPMHGGFDSFARVVDVPFVARHSHRQHEETRRAFGIPQDRRMVLSSFGGYGLRGLPLDRLDCLDAYAVVTTETTARDSRSASATHPAVIALEEHLIYGGGFRYEDLVRAADVVLTKPGYGIIAECLANDTALVYTSRGRFREYDVLVRELPQVIAQDDLFAGRWRAALDRALAQPLPVSRPATNGADHVAALLGARLEGV